MARNGGITLPQLRELRLARVRTHRAMFALPGGTEPTRAEVSTRAARAAPDPAGTGDAMNATNWTCCSNPVASADRCGDCRCVYCDNCGECPRCGE